MALKDLFIKSDESDKQKETPKGDNLKFPKVEKQENTESSIFNFGFGTTKQTTSFTPAPTGGVSQEHIDKALQVYNQGFDSLNQPGYDFYEFYHQLTEEDRKDPKAYQMAVRFASASDKSITKDSLVQQADYYIGKIVDSYNNFVNSGNSKKQEFLSQKANENQSLNGELGMLKQQLEAIQTQIADRENKLATIDNKYAVKISEIDSKLAANDIAKSQIVNSIEQVKQGIISNVK